MRACLGVDELGVHPHLIAAVLFAPLEHIAHAEVSAICFTSAGLPLYVNAVLRAITNVPLILERSVVSPSVMTSAR